MRAMQITVYGIPNCDTVRKARAWLYGQGLAYRFHDFRKDGVPSASLDRWLAGPAAPLLLNRKGTTWRQLDAAAQAGAATPAGARALMLAQPSVIKRPVVEWPGGDVTVGFDSDAWALLTRR